MEVINQNALPQLAQIEQQGNPQDAVNHAQGRPVQPAQPCAANVGQQQVPQLGLLNFLNQEGARQILAMYQNIAPLEQNVVGTIAITENVVANNSARMLGVFSTLESIVFDEGISPFEVVKLLSKMLKQCSPLAIKFGVATGDPDRQALTQLMRDPLITSIFVPPIPGRADLDRNGLVQSLTRLSTDAAFLTCYSQCGGRISEVNEIISLISAIGFWRQRIAQQSLMPNMAAIPNLDALARTIYAKVLTLGPSFTVAFFTAKTACYIGVKLDLNGLLKLSTCHKWQSNGYFLPVGIDQLISKNKPKNKKKSKKAKKNSPNSDNRAQKDSG